MTSRSKSSGGKIDHLMEQATEALTATDYASCEQMCREALDAAHAANDFERMARILMPLQESRRQRRQQASDHKKVHRMATYAELEAILTGAAAFKPGCYLLEPPLVGADGTELGERALAENVPAVVLVREPVTRLGLWPLVAVGPVTVRIRTKPPKKPDVAWLLAAREEMGDSALSSIDPQSGVEMRVTRLLDALATMWDHEKMHQALREACEEAHRASLEQPKRGRRRAAAPVSEDEDDGFGAEEE